MAEHQLEGAHADLGRTDHRGEQQGLRRRMAEAAQHLDHLQLHPGEDEGAEGEADRQQQVDAAEVVGRHGAADGRGAGGGRMHRRPSWQDQQVDRQAGEQMDRRIEEQGETPADRGLEHARQRPEERRGKAADDGQHGDRLARARAGDLDDGNAGRVAERQGRGDTHDCPAGKIAQRALAHRDADQGQRIDHRSGRHQAARADPVDHLADARRADRVHGEHHGDAGEDQLGRDVEVVLQVPAEHRRHEVGRAPADDLGEAEAHSHAGRGRKRHLAEHAGPTMEARRAESAPTVCVHACGKSGSRSRGS